MTTKTMDMTKNSMEDKNKENYWKKAYLIIKKLLRKDFFDIDKHIIRSNDDKNYGFFRRIINLNLKDETQNFSHYLVKKIKEILKVSVNF